MLHYRADESFTVDWLMTSPLRSDLTLSLHKVSIIQHTFRFTYFFVSEKHFLNLGIQQFIQIKIFKNYLGQCFQYFPPGNYLKKKVKPQVNGTEF